MTELTNDLTRNKPLATVARPYRRDGQDFRALCIMLPEFTVQARSGLQFGKQRDWLAIGPSDTPDKPDRWIIPAEEFESTCVPN